MSFKAWIRSSESVRGKVDKGGTSARSGALVGGAERGDGEGGGSV
jgi:hypothetical protein